MYEIFGNGGANTMHRRINGPEGGGRGGAGGGRGGGMTAREWYRPVPPYAEVDWSARNNTNYSETGVLSALQLTAAFPQIVLENFYKKSRNSIDAGRKDDIHGYVIPVRPGSRRASRSSSIRCACKASKWAAPRAKSS